MIEEQNNGKDDEFAVAAMKSIDSRLLEGQHNQCAMSANSPITLQEIVSYEEIIIETSQVEDGRQAMCCITRVKNMGTYH